MNHTTLTTTLKLRMTRKIIISALIFLSMSSLSASAEQYMNRYISQRDRTHLIAGEFIAEYNIGLKALFMAKTEALYDMSMSSYLKSFFVETTESNTIRVIKEVDSQIRERLAILQNNTWEAWGWSAAKYSAVILATYYLTKCSLTASTVKV